MSHWVERCGGGGSIALPSAGRPRDDPVSDAPHLRQLREVEGKNTKYYQNSYTVHQSYSPISSTMSDYASNYPSVDFDPAYKKFFEDFYATSDTPDAHDKYTTYFTKDATLIMASKTVKGSEGTCTVTLASR